MKNQSRSLVAFVVSFVLIAMLLIASAETPTNSVTIRLTESQLATINLASNAKSGVYKDKEVADIVQQMIDSTLTRYQNFRDRGASRGKANKVSGEFVTPEASN
jgi:hypothetical protein